MNLRKLETTYSSTLCPTLSILNIALVSNEFFVTDLDINSMLAFAKATNRVEE